MDGKHSTLDDKRQSALEKMNFVWDSRSICWEERFNELRTYKAIHGHANVPKTYKANKRLAIWVRSQRRLFRLHDHHHHHGHYSSGPSADGGSSPPPHHHHHYQRSSP